VAAAANTRHGDEFEDTTVDEHRSFGTTEAMKGAAWDTLLGTETVILLLNGRDGVQIVGTVMQTASENSGDEEVVATPHYPCGEGGQISKEAQLVIELFQFCSSGSCYSESGPTTPTGIIETQL